MLKATGARPAGDQMGRSGAEWRGERVESGEESGDAVGQRWTGWVLVLLDG